MSTTSDHDTHDPATIRLIWHQESMTWHGRCRRDVSAQNPAIARSGPAGVVFVEEGDLCVSLCYLTGRVEQVWIPAERDSAQQALLTHVFRGPLPNLDAPEHADATRDLLAKEAAERTESFRWARLHVDMDDPEEDGEAAEVLRLVELAATAADLKGLAPEWLTTERVGAHLRSARAAVEAAGGIGIPDDGSDDDGVDAGAQWARGEMETRARKWLSSFRKFAGRPTDPDAAADTNVLVESLEIAWPRLAHRPIRGRGGAAILGSVATADPHPPTADGEATPLSARLRVAGTGDLAGHDATERVDADGTFAIPELVARRFGAAPGRGRIDPPEPRGWSQVRMDAAADASPLASRWAVLYAEDRTVVGAGALRCTSTREAPDGRVLVGDVAQAGRPGRIALTTHPAVPLHPVGERPSLERALEAARSAFRLDVVAGSGAVQWSESALDWLQVGMVYRAAWAHRRADADRFAEGFGGDTPELATALAILTAALASGTVPGKPVLDSWVYAPAWWFVARLGPRAIGVQE